MEILNKKTIELVDKDDSGGWPLCLVGCGAGCASTGGTLLATWAATYLL